ncbi:GntR family transcriptional regulator [Rhodovulum sulfidophilum]|uniref:GntR family transcriptional regulator n=1 Tax=Rhodovulum sulfidophilum TaxID=35806 RepID=UPI001922DDA3|nr:GntR family transcriptional regulator [Rhodovulum sulfidophilum]MBL3575961.1 GntR family transcriptional regulator [Rhodovulum sulfidophilum]MCE8431860.1 GntR family transcriptional regulator [Rhodovulum sulfidophilum]MCF4115694.1 GntR family transcriptional regulator [Rhodovulum sulfidophilum]
MSVSDDLHTELRRRLISGQYDPGAKLREEHVATEFGVSRTPVRVAIQRLVEEGLLEAAPNRGAVVSEWRDSDTEEIFELRVLAEGQAAAWATRHITDAELERMDALNTQIAQAVESKHKGYLDEVQSANLAFHTALYEACGSARLRLFGTNLLEYPLVIGGFFIYTDDDARESVRQHAEIVNALRTRNADWARAAVTSHLCAAIERFRKTRKASRNAAKALPRGNGSPVASAED